MSGPCLCGDDYCPYCGGQYDTSHIEEWLTYIVDEKCPAPVGIDREWLVEYLMYFMGQYQELADAVDALARDATKPSDVDLSMEDAYLDKCSWDFGPVEK